MTRFTVFIATSLALCAAATASAQEGGATLRVDRGNVMTSQGGEFASAKSGQSVVAGERLMITEGSTATLTYPKGCTRQFSAPGVYVIGAACPTTTQGTDWAAAAKIVVVGVVTAAVLHNGPDRLRRTARQPLTSSGQRRSTIALPAMPSG